MFHTTPVDRIRTLGAGDVIKIEGIEDAFIAVLQFVLWWDRHHECIAALTIKRPHPIPVGEDCKCV
jgi:hypothetical protein